MALRLETLKHSKLIKFIVTISLILSSGVIYYSEHLRYQKDHLTTKSIASSYVSLLETNLVHAVSATYPLAALIRFQKGDTDGFEGLATQMLEFYPSVSSLQLQPNGIISHIVPLIGNEKIFGHDLFSDANSSKEAMRTRDTGQLTLAGPFNLIQGGTGVIARLPIYLTQAGKPVFWGFSSALIKLPDIIKASQLMSLTAAGYAYQLSRNNSATGEVYIFAQSTAPLNGDPEKFFIDVPNGQWIFSITSTKGMKLFPQIFIKTFIGLLFTLLLTFLTFLLVRLKEDHLHLESLIAERTKELEALAHYDVLTQLPNRTLFIDRFAQAMAYSQRTEKMTD